MTPPAEPTPIDLDSAMNRLIDFAYRHPEIELDVGRLVGAILAVQAFPRLGPDATDAERDEALAAQLERAAKAAESAMLGEAAARIRRGGEGRTNVMKHRNRILTVSDLRAILAAMDDSAVVLVPYGSHEYRTPEVTVGTAMQHRKGRRDFAWWEDFGDLKLEPGEDPGERVAALILG